MARVIELPSDGEAGHHANTAAPIPSPVEGAGARPRKSLARHMLAPMRFLAKVISARFLAVMAIVLAGVAMFFGPAGAPRGSLDRLDAVEQTVRRLETNLATPSQSRADGANPTTLLVAVQFVTAAAERSTPFDTALAVAISLTGQHAKVGPLLDELLTEAATGVPSQADLRAEFHAKLGELDRLGLLADSGEGASFLRLSRLWDWSGPEVKTEHHATLQKLSSDVANLNIAQAVQLLGKLDGRPRDALENWREKAQRRVAVDAVLTELRRTAFIGLIEQSQ